MPLRRAEKSPSIPLPCTPASPERGSCWGLALHHLCQASRSESMASKPTAILELSSQAAFLLTASAVLEQALASPGQLVSVRALAWRKALTF